MKRLLHITAWVAVLLGVWCCQSKKPSSDVSGHEAKKIPVIFDTDANNELDDQHALAYLLFNGGTFDVRAITVNATSNGGDITQHLAEAARVMRLCKADGRIPLLKGANGNFETIEPTLQAQNYDGYEAVDFIIREAMRERDQKLVLIPVGKLTNIALALKKAPAIKDKIRIVWLGSNYPEPGEYNQVNDEPALRYILDQAVPFEMVLVRYGKQSGSDAVRVTMEDIQANLPHCGLVADSVEGRHGHSFTCFGDYSVDLFSHAQMHGTPPSRALFDLVAVAITKNANWGVPRQIPAPDLVEGKWKERLANSRKITLWENFDRGAIIGDFYKVMKKPVPAATVVQE